MGTGVERIGNKSILSHITSSSIENPKKYAKRLQNSLAGSRIKGQYSKSSAFLYANN